MGLEAFGADGSRNGAMTTNFARTQNGMIAGQVIGNVYRKEVYSHRHLLRKPLAWSIDAGIFDRVITPLCTVIEIYDRDTGNTFTVSVKDFREKCHILDRGHGKQYYLELVFWTSRKGG